MPTKHKDRESIDVGASKAARIILGGVDRQLIKPAVILVRISGWILVASIIYVAFFENLSQVERQSVKLWIYVYVAYMILLEFMRKASSETYEKAWFRSMRVAFNLIMISILIYILPAERHFIIFAYTVPLLAAIVYSGENNWLKFGVYVFALIGIYSGGIIFDRASALKLSHFLIYAGLLAGFTIGFEILRRKINLIPGRLTELAKELHKTLDLHQLITEILANAIGITVAQRGLVIIINPRTKKYVDHILYNFDLKPGHSIEWLAKKCFVLVHGEAFESPDIISIFHEKSIYHEFFETQPRSVMAEPLYNRAGQVIGVVNVAHNAPNGFDKIARNLLKEFAFLVSNAIENCFDHREVELRDAKSREAGERFVSAGSENDAIHILMEEVREQIPHTEKLTIHQFLPDNGELLPVHSFSLENTPNLYLWSSVRSKKLKPDLRLGYGIAGHALESRDTILVHDVDHHPWYVKLEHAQEIKSLLVAPLFDPQGSELYGTISLESSKPGVFNLDDESTLTFLSTQASRAIAKDRDFQVWREQGGTLRKILEQIGKFDISGTERSLCEQITTSAAQLLGFKIARIRLLSKDDMLVTVAVTGVPIKTTTGLLKKDLPYRELKPFLDPRSKAESSYLIKRGTPGWKEFVDRYFHKPRVAVQKKSSWDVYDALITPLLNSSGELIGILTLDVPVSGIEPNRHILELIGVFTNAVSWVIELSRSQREQRHRAQSFIDTISQELAKGRDLPTISEVVVQVGAKLLSAEGCSLYIVRGTDIELTHSNYLENTDYISRSKPISSLPKSGLTAWVASTGETICFNNGEHKKHPSWAGEKNHLEYLPSKTCQSLLITPVKDKEGKVIAVITLENKKTLGGLKDFDKGDERRLQSLANEFAKALDVIGLYEDIREWERSGLAEDIHDLINWYHSGVVMWIEALDQWYKQNDEDKIKELMPELLQHAYTTVYELKTLHTNILKKSFEASTLRQALHETMSVWKTRATPRYKEEMQIQLLCPENIEIPARLRNTIVRIASLAFSNAIQHSGIVENPDVNVVVRVEKKENETILSVIDNGKGIDLKNIHPGFGLDRMQQLTEKINFWGDVESKLEIESAVGEGTKLFLRLTPKNHVAP